MFSVNSVLLLFLIWFYVSNCQRRIKDGVDLKQDRRYVVYLVKAPMSDKGYDSWLCGGAIVNSLFVVTSAACVNDVNYLYVIAGSKVYVPDSQIETDKCTSKMKKKVIYTCSPKGYELKYGELDYWSYIDIALLKVESPFDFNDPNYETLCSYKPTSIPINYEEKYQEPGTDAMVLGWGHLQKWRKPADKANYNQPTLKYAPTLLLKKDACIEHYVDYANMTIVIKTYMICSLGAGNIDDEGNPIQQDAPLQNGCTSRQQKLLGFEGVSCEKRSTESSDEDDTRRYDRGSNQTRNYTTNDFNTTWARRSGICQNDHGGPLITWVGSKEILIGIASVFKVSGEYECMGPYLYTSTRCTGLFLSCILESEFPDRRSSRRYLCDRPPSERGYDTIERTISWKDHPAGPAENENIGRSDPEPKYSAGLKYLNNNSNQPPNAGNDNDDSNNKYQAYRNPPIVSTVPEERISVQESKHEEEPKYESNKMYSANNNPLLIRNEPEERYAVHKSILGQEHFQVKDRQQEAAQYKPNNQYSAITSVAHNEKFEVMGRSPETDNIPGKQNLRENDRSPVPNFHVNGGSPGQNAFLANERYPLNRNPNDETYQAIVRQPGIQIPPANQRYPVNHKFPKAGRYPVSMGPPNNLQRIPTGMAI